MDSDDSTPRDPTSSYNGADILGHIARLGDYFRLDSGIGAEWQELPAMIEHSRLTESVARTRSAIADWAGCEVTDIPVRMAASSFQLGIVSRLISPAVGAAVTSAVVPLLTANSLTWTTTASHFPRFGVAGVEWSRAPGAVDAAALISSSLIGDVIVPFNDAVRAVTALSPKVMWGNVTSAANGAVTVLALSQPQLENRGRALVRALLDTEHLGGTAHIKRNKFVRRSCCLFYLAPNSGLCGDCILAE